MKNIFLSLLLTSLSLFAYADSDLDGVEDKFDKCPNSALTDLVDVHGCTKESLVSNHHFDIIVGASYGVSDYELTPKTESYSSTIQVDYYFKSFSMQVATSFFKSESDTYSEDSLADSTVAMYYGFYPSKSFSITVGAGALLPTYSSSLDNNEVDYLTSLSLSYRIGSVSIFGGYNYTLINDKDIGSVVYQNTNAFSGGLGYSFTYKFYASLSYFQSNSIYENVDDIQSASVYMFYSINKNWFTNITYSKGLSDTSTEHYGALKVGYYF